VRGNHHREWIRCECERAISIFVRIPAVIIVDGRQSMSRDEWTLDVESVSADYPFPFIN